MASRIRGSLKTLGFCVGTVGTAVGTIVFCVGTVGTGGKGYIEYLPLSGPYGPYAKNKRFETTSDARGHRPEHTEISEWPAYFDGSTAFCALVKTHDSHDSVLYSFN